MTVLEVIQRSAEFLSKKGIESPRLQVELLLAHVLKMPRMKLYLNFERALSEPELQTYRELVKRRGQREPLQHIVGTANFCGYEFEVNQNVLIPRPETELLAERAWKHIEGSTDQMQKARALDFGTGCGCLAILLALKCPLAEIHALDVSSEALSVAQRNASRHLVQDRIQFYHSDGFKELGAGLVFDLIVTNPPYIPSNEIETLEPEVRDHDPRLALDGGVSGLDFYEMLAQQAGNRLTAGGLLMCEFGEGQGEDLQNIFRRQNWIVEAIEQDYTQRLRFLIARHSQ